MGSVGLKPSLALTALHVRSSNLDQTPQHLRIPNKSSLEFSRSVYAFIRLNEKGRLPSKSTTARLGPTG